MFILQQTRSGIIMARRAHRGKAAQRRITDTKHKEGHKGDGEKTSTAVEFPCERELPPPRAGRAAIYFSCTWEDQTCRQRRREAEMQLGGQKRSVVCPNECEREANRNEVTDRDRSLTRWGSQPALLGRRLPSRRLTGALSFSSQ